MKGVTAIISRAEAKFRKIGGHPRLIPFGARGEYKGIKVVLERCDSYGSVVVGLYKGGYANGREEYEEFLRDYEDYKHSLDEVKDLLAHN